MEQKHLDFIINCELQDEILFLDRLHIEQVEMNLIGNAMKYTPAGGKITYSVTQIGSEDNMAVVKVVVSDTGIGMSEEFQKSVFEIFTREDNDVVRGVQGSGLGISITKSFVEMMDGTISCESQPGKGTSFTMIYKMSNMDGYTATTEIRRLSNRKLAQIPVIAMTAHAFKEDVEKALESGMNGHVAKPIDIQKLAETMERVLRQESHKE